MSDESREGGCLRGVGKEHARLMSSTRHYGLMLAAGTQWLNNYGVTKATPLMVIKLNKGGIVSPDNVFGPS